jgi:alkyl hydroperoxide reductase subunit AhpC
LIVLIESMVTVAIGHSLLAVCPTEIVDFSEHASIFICDLITQIRTCSYETRVADLWPHVRHASLPMQSSKFKDIGCEVIGASIDSANSHHAWMNTPRNKGGLGPMKIPLLADVSKEVARSLGFLVENPADDLNGIALRGTVIIDPSGTIRQLTVNDAPVGRSVGAYEAVVSLHLYAVPPSPLTSRALSPALPSAEETLRLVQAFQYTDKHGEVCPSGWKPGAKTMKADPKGSQEYFSQLK